MIAEERPDLVVITGDSISSGFDPDGFAAFLASLKAPLGVFACEGNWENWNPESLEGYRRSGVRLLVGESERIGGDIDVVGLSSPRSRIPAGDGALRILLCHFPGIARRIPEGAFHLVLAGHMHAGQIVVPYPGGKLRLAHLRARDVEGLYAYGSTVLHVSPGLGTTFVPFRLFARPEVTELVLRSA